ncbi:MAG: A24 family peptidase, partial [Pseudomonadota bacterium]
CGVTLPRWLLGLELLAGALGIAAVVAGDGLIGALVLWLLLALGAVDAAVFRLPNLLVAALLLAVLLRAPDLSQALIGAALGSGIFALIRWGYGAMRGREGMGLGDVKLMAPLGAFVGPLLLPQLVLVAAALAFAGALVLRRSGEALSAATPLPFGTALCASAFLLWVVLGL